MKGILCGVVTSDLIARRPWIRVLQSTLPATYDTEQLIRRVMQQVRLAGYLIGIPAPA